MSAETTKFNEVCEQNEYEKINSKLDSLENKCNQSVLKSEEIKLSNEISRFWMDVVVKRDKNPNLNQYYLLKDWVLFNKPQNLNQIFDLAKKIDDLINIPEDLQLDWKFNFRRIRKDDSLFFEDSIVLENIDHWNSLEERKEEVMENNNLTEELFKFAWIFREKLWHKDVFNPELEQDMIYDRNWNRKKIHRPLWFNSLYNSKQILEADQK